MIYGISGKKTSGKDTVGKILQILLSDVKNIPTSTVVKMLESDKKDYTYKIEKFASPLKQIVCILIGCTMEQLEDENFKNKELGEDWTKEKFGLTKRWTPRMLLQTIGTDLFKKRISDKVWINTAKNIIRDSVIFTDVRFPDEANMLKNKGAVLIRVNSTRNNSEDNHASETSLDNYKDFSYTVDNNGTKEDLVNKIKEILNYGNSN